MSIEGLTWKPSVVTKALKQLFEDNSYDLGLEQVCYGDTEMVYKTPSVTISVDSATRELYATGGRTENRLSVEIYVHYSSFEEDELKRELCDELTERMVEFLDANQTLGGLLTHAYASRIDPIGATVGRDDLIKSGRIIWTAVSVTRLGA